MAERSFLITLKRRLKVAAKWLLIVGLGVFLFLLIISIVLIWFFPQEKLVAAGESLLSQTLNGRTVQIDEARINLRYLHLKRVRIDDLPQYGDDPLFTCKEIRLSYNLRAVWRRRIVVHQVRLIDPYFHFKQFGVTYTNFSDFISPDSALPEPSPPPEETFIQLAVERVQIDNLHYAQTLFDTLFLQGLPTPPDTLMSWHIAGASAVSEAWSPLDFDQLTFPLTITSTAPNLHYYQKDGIDLQSRAVLEANVTIREHWLDYHISATLDLDHPRIRVAQDSLSWIPLFLETARANVTTHMNFDAGYIRLEHALVTVPDDLQLQMSGEWSEMYSAFPHYELNVTTCQLNLASLKHLAPALFPPTVELAGDLIVWDSGMKGQLTEDEPLEITLNSQLLEGKFRHLSTQTGVSTITLDSQLNAQVIVDSTNPALPFRGRNWWFYSMLTLDEIRTPQQTITPGTLTLEVSTMVGETFQSLRENIDLFAQIKGDPVTIISPETRHTIGGYRADLFADIKHNATDISVFLDSLWVHDMSWGTTGVPPFSAAAYGIVDIHLTPDYQPQMLSLSLFDARARGLRFTADKLTVTDIADSTRAAANGTFHLSGFDVALLNSPLRQCTGILNADVSLAGLLRQTTLDLNADLTDFTWVQEDSLVVDFTDVPVTLNSRIKGNLWRGDLDLTYLNVASEPLELRATGDLHQWGHEKAHLYIDSLTVHHLSLADRLPLLAVYETFDGETQLYGDVDAHFPSKTDPGFNLNLHLQGTTPQMELRYLVPHTPESAGLRVTAQGQLQSEWIFQGQFDSSTPEKGLTELPHQLKATLGLNPVYAKLEHIPVRQADPTFAVECQDISGSIHLDWQPGQKQLRWETQIKNIHGLLPAGDLEDTGLVEFRATMALEPGDLLDLRDWQLLIPREQVNASLQGTIYNVNIDRYLQTLSDTTLPRSERVSAANQQLLEQVYPDVLCRFSLARADDPLHLPLDSQLGGNVALQLTLSRYFPQVLGDNLPNQFQVEGSLGLDAVYFQQAPALAIHQTTGYVPFHYVVDVDVVQGRKSPLSRVAYPQATHQQKLKEADYWFLAPYYDQLPENERSHVTIDSIRWGRYHADDVQVVARFEDNVIYLDEIELTLYGGQLWGSMYFDTANGILPEMHYRAYGELTNVDFDALVGRTSLQKEQVLLTTNFAFQGKGLDFEHDFDLSGEFDITEIGEHVADRLLLFLDPDQKDPSLAGVRTLMKSGYKIERFTSRVNLGILNVSVYLRPPFWLRTPLFRLHLPNPIPVTGLSVGQLIQQMEVVE